jgi:hypothetical protein
MITIHKYPIEAFGLVQMHLPKGAEILSGQFQDRRFCIWAKINTDNDLEIRNLVILGTGFGFPKDMNLKFIATAQDRIFVWHLFEEVKEGPWT